MLDLVLTVFRNGGDKKLGVPLMISLDTLGPEPQMSKEVAEQWVFNDQFGYARARTTDVKGSSRTVSV